MFPTSFGRELRLSLLIDHVQLKEVYQNELLKSDFQHQFCPKILWDCLNYFKQRLSATKNSLLKQVGPNIEVSQIYYLQKTLIRNIHSSPEYWLQQRGDLMSLKQDLKMPTFFVTLSPNEKQWVDTLHAFWSSNYERLCQPTTNPPDIYLLDLEDTVKRDLIANNPVVTVEMVFRRFKHI